MPSIYTEKTIVFYHLVDQVQYSSMNLAETQHLYNVLDRELQSFRDEIPVSTWGQISSNGILLLTDSIPSFQWITAIYRLMKKLNDKLETDYHPFSGLGVSTILTCGSALIDTLSDGTRVAILGQVEADLHELSQRLEVGQLAVNSCFLPNIDEDPHQYTTSLGGRYYESCAYKSTSDVVQDVRYSYTVDLKEFDPELQKSVLNEAKYLLSILSDTDQCIEVIGSSWIRDVKSKRCIDFMAKVDLDDKVKKILAIGGYEEIELNTITLRRRHFFRRKDTEHGIDFNLHIVDCSYWCYSRERRLRRALTSNEHLALLYSSAKVYLAESTQGCALHYGIRKDRFIRWLESDLGKRCHHDEVGIVICDCGPDAEAELVNDPANNALSYYIFNNGIHNS